MRGIRSAPLSLATAQRITPAHAGNTLPGCCWLRKCWDHPRACGEYLPPTASVVLGIGSPPRMRGILGGKPSADVQAGITPAHAGNTLFIVNTTNNHRDHPRACGEYLPPTASVVLGIGSPPRMRGILGGKPSADVQAGITPAHAGNTHVAGQRRAAL